MKLIFLNEANTVEILQTDCNKNISWIIGPMWAVFKHWIWPIFLRS